MVDKNMPCKTTEKKLKYVREYYRSHREKRLKYFREYNHSHRESRLEYYRGHREERLRYSHEYYGSHKEKILSYSREYRLTHTRQYDEYYAKNKEKMLACARKHHSAHRKEDNERTAKYQRMVRIKTHSVVFDILREHSFKCDRCGFNDARALEIHHMFGNHNARNPYAKFLELKNRKVPIAVLCANCHKILHNQRKMTANGEQITVALQGIQEIQQKVKT